MRGRLLALLGALLVMGAAAQPSDRLQDPAQEARARHLFQQLRCVVCQNQSIDDSDADLASDLRRIVREQVSAGRSDRDIRAFLVQRYGEFILLQPPLNPGNLALWLSPLLLAGAGGTYLWLRSRAAAKPEEEAVLSPDEERALARLAQDGPTAANKTA